MGQITYSVCDSCGKSFADIKNLRTIQIIVSEGGGTTNPYAPRMTSKIDLCESCCPKFNINYEKFYRQNVKEAEENIVTIEDLIANIVNDQLFDKGIE